MQKRPIVLDIGSNNWRCGFAGEGTPRCVIRTPLSIRHQLGRYVQDVDVSLKSLNAIQSEETLSQLIRYIFYEQLLVKPKEHRIIICEHHDVPHLFRASFVKVLFKYFGSPSIFLNSCSSFALHAAGCRSGLVIDVGYRETRVVPFAHGVPLYHASTTASVGAVSLHTYIRRLVAAEWLAETSTTGNRRTMQELDVHLEDVVRKACVVVQKDVDKSQISDYTYRSNGCEICVRGIHRAQASEILFGTPQSQSQQEIQNETQDKTKEQEKNKDMEGENKQEWGSSIGVELNVIGMALEEDSILTAIVDVLRNCESECQRHVSRSIVLTGGTADLFGFKERLLAEIENLVTEARTIKMPHRHPTILAILSLTNTKIISIPSTSSSVSWLGGSIVGSVEGIRTTSNITLQQWSDNGGRLPDRDALLFQKKKTNNKSGNGKNGDTKRNDNDNDNGNENDDNDNEKEGIRHVTLPKEATSVADLAQKIKQSGAIPFPPFGVVVSSALHSKNMAGNNLNSVVDRVETTTVSPIAKKMKPVTVTTTEEATSLIEESTRTRQHDVTRRMKATEESAKETTKETEDLAEDEAEEVNSLTEEATEEIAKETTRETKDLAEEEVEKDQDIEEDVDVEEEEEEEDVEEKELQADDKIIVISGTHIGKHGIIIKKTAKKFSLELEGGKKTSLNHNAVKRRR